MFYDEHMSFYTKTTKIHAPNIRIKAEAIITGYVLRAVTYPDTLLFINHMLESDSFIVWFDLNSTVNVAIESGNR